MANIYKGDKGTRFQLTIKDEQGVVDLRGSTVNMVIKGPKSRIEKPATLIDGELGVVEVALDETETGVAGNYNLQVLVTFANGNRFASSINKFTIANIL